MWFLYPSSRESGGPDLRAKARQRERDREAPRDPERQREPYPGGPLVAEPPTLDPPADSRIRMLGDERTQHLGRRADRRSDEQITRADREKAVLWMLGVFRVATRRSVVESCFDGHPFVANRVLADLESKKLIRKREVKHGKRGYQVYTLEGQGRDLLALERLRLDQQESTAGPQRYWSDVGDKRQLRHDHHVFDAVCADSKDVLNRGGRVVRVRLESELRGRLAAAESGGRSVGGAEGARKARMAEARGLGLRVSAAGVPLPDVLVELEDADGRRIVRAVEVSTSAYSGKQVRAKRDAQFRVYSIPSFKTAGNRKASGTLRDEELFPLSWGR